MDSYSPHLAVSEHAVQRFRERARDFLEEGGHLSDAAVSFQLDFAIWDAMEDEQKTYDILDSNQASKLVHLENEKWGSLWALVRENKNPRYPQRWAVITCLTDWQMTQNALDGRYAGNVPRLPQFARHFEAAARPRLVTPAVPASAVAAASAATSGANSGTKSPTALSAPLPDAAQVATAQAPAPAQTAETSSGATATAGAPDMITAAVAALAHAAPASTPASASAPLVQTSADAPAPQAHPDDRRLLAWRDPVSGARHFEELARAEVIARIVAICATGVPLAQIEVWRPSAVRFDVE